MKIIIRISILAIVFTFGIVNITSCKKETFPISETSLDYKQPKLDSLFNYLENGKEFMGSICMSHNGNTVYKKSVGFDDVSSGEKSDDGTKYRIGSISKMITSTLVFKAIEEGKLTLDDKIEKYFPDVVNSKIITIGNLLNHRSGIHDFTWDQSYGNWYTKSKSRKEMIDIISNFKSDFTPNSTADYSNSNYVLLSIILETAYGKSFSDILDQKIILPLGLKNTYFGNKINISNNECHSYTYLGKWTQQNQTDMSIPLGAGSIVSNPSDISKFIESLFGEKIIKKEHVIKMRRMGNGYGFGIFEFKHNGKRAYGHSGSIDGFISYLMYFPNENLSIAFCTNGSNYDSKEIVDAALSCYWKEAVDISTFQSIKISASELDKYLGRYSSQQITLKITFSKEDATLIAQGTGQPAGALTYKGNHKFNWSMAGALFIFTPDKNEMILRQGGSDIKFVKD